MEFNININVIKDISGLSLWVSDDFGGSGIEVEGDTPEEVAENLLPYLIDYFSGHISKEDDEDNDDEEENDDKDWCDNEM
jgi:hypothetical protein